jgi:hypothetical protein
MNSKLCKEACKKLNLEVLEVKKDYLITNNGIWCTVYNNKRIFQLQQKFGTGNVNYCPEPSFIFRCRHDHKRGKFTYILTKSGDTDTSEAIAICKRLELPHKTINLNMEGLTNLSLYTTLNNAKFIILNGNCRTTHINVAFMTGIPLIALHLENVQFTELCRLAGLRRLNVRNAADVNWVWDNRDIVAETMNDTLDRMQAHLSWLSNVEIFNPRVGNTPTTLKYSLDSKTVTTGYFTAATTCLSAGSRKGAIHFLPTTLHLCEPLLHPWVGCIDSLSVGAVQQWLRLPTTEVSLSFCLGLFVYHADIAALFSCDVDILPVAPLLLPNYQTFSYTKSCAGIENANLLDNVTIITDLTTVSLNTIFEIIARHTPVMLPRTKLSTSIFGSRYPCYVSNPQLEIIQKTVTLDKIEAASRHLATLSISLEKYYAKLSKTLVGSKLL